MDGRQNLSGLELEIDLRATALTGFMAALSEHRADLLAALDGNGWMLARESHTVAEIIDSHRRILERFLCEQAEILRARVEAEIETTVVTALAETDALALSPTALERAATLTTFDRRQRSLSTHPSNPRLDHADTDTDTVAGATSSGVSVDRHEPAADAVPDGLSSEPSPVSPPDIDSSLLFGTSPSLERGEHLINQLLDQWAQHEREEAKALVDDAHARAAVLLHVATLEAGAPPAHRQLSAAPVELNDDIAALLAPGIGDWHHQLDTLATALAQAGPLELTDLTWSDADADADADVDEARYAPTAQPEDERHAPAATADDDDATVPAAQATGQTIDIVTLDDEQLELAFADFWSGDIARNALETALADRSSATVRHSTARRSGRRTPAAPRQLVDVLRHALLRRTDHRESILAAGITPIIAITGLVTLLMALLG